MKNLLIIPLLLFCFAAGAQITYTKLGASGYRLSYLVGDSGVTVPFRDTTLGRGITRPGSFVISTHDSLPYYYNGYKWKPLFVDSLGVLSIAKDKVDSVTYSGLYAYYWVNGVGVGKIYLDTTTTVASLYQNSLKSAYVPDISALKSYTGNSTTVIVQDSVRGGTFNYVTTGTPDSGTVFVRSGGGYWQRNIPNSTLNANWFGLIANGTTNDKSNLRVIFNNANGKKVVFPKNKTIYLGDSMLVSLNNANIDFNGCTLKIDTNSVGNRMLTLYGCTNSTFTNLIFDGNRTHRNPATQDLALTIDSSSNLYFDNLLFHDVNYHPIYIQPQTPHINFGIVRFLNNTGTSNISDIYVSNDSLSSLGFNHIICNRDTYDSIAEAVYNDGWNVNIGTIEATNYGLISSTRMGSNTIGNIIAQTCGGLLYVQADANTYLHPAWNYPSLTVNSIFGRNIKGFTGVDAAIYVDLAKSLRINFVDIDMDSTSISNEDGIEITELYNPTPSVFGVSLNNINIRHAAKNAIHIVHNNSPIVLNNVIVSNSPSGIRLDSAKNYITAYDYSYSGVATPANVTGINYLKQVKSYGLIDTTNAIPAYKLLGRAAGTGTASFIGNLDSNFVADYHSSSYYNTIFPTATGTKWFLPRWTGTHTQSASSSFFDDGVNTGFASTGDPSSGMAARFNIYGTFNPNGVPTRATGISTDNDGADYLNSMGFWVGNTGTMSESMKLTYDGKLGIGNLSPTQKLNVGGQIKIDAVQAGSTGDSALTIHNGIISAVKKLDTSQLPQTTLKTGPNLATNTAGDSLFFKKRVFQIASSATHTYNTDTVRIYIVTAQASSCTFANPTGATPNEATEIEIRIKDNGTSQGLSWGTNWQGSTGLALPTATTLGKTMWLKFEYDAIAGKEDLISLRDGF